MTKFKCITKTPTKTSRVLRESMPKVKQSSKTPSKVKPPSRILSPTRSLQILEKGKKLQIHSQKKHDHDLPSLDKSLEKLDEPTTPNANESYEDLTNTTSASPKLNRSLSLQEFTIKPSSVKFFFKFFCLHLYLCCNYYFRTIPGRIKLIAFLHYLYALANLYRMNVEHLENSIHTMISIYQNYPRKNCIYSIAI